MMAMILLALSAAVGAVLRSLISEHKIFNRPALPYGTFTVNALGSLLMGLGMPLISQESILYFIVIFGFLGGFTTYSAFAVEQFRLLEQKRFKELMKYTFMSLFFCLVALALGLLIGISLV